MILGTGTKERFLSYAGLETNRCANHVWKSNSSLSHSTKANDAQDILKVRNSTSRQTNQTSSTTTEPRKCPQVNYQKDSSSKNTLVPVLTVQVKSNIHVSLFSHTYPLFCDQFGSVFRAVYQSSRSHYMTQGSRIPSGRADVLAKLRQCAPLLSLDVLLPL